MARGPWIDIKMVDFSGGWNTRIDNNLIGDNQSPDLQNVVFDGKGSIMPRLGNLIFGATTSATGEIRRTWVTINSREIETPIRQVDDATNSWLEYYNAQTAAWENLDAGVTSGYDLGSAFYNYYTYFCSQKDSQKRWNGAYHSISAAIGVGHTSCDLNTSAVSAIGFLSAGSLVVDGEEIYYTSANSKKFYTTAFTAAHNVNTGVAQLPTSAGEIPAPDGGWVSASSASPKGSMMYEMDAQMFVAGASAVSGNIVYYSWIDSPTNYTISATPGGGGSARYPETPGSIHAITDFDKLLTILKDNTIRQLEFQDLADGTSGSLEIVNRKNIITGPKIGAINNKGLTKVENDAIFVAPSGWIKSLSQTTDGNKVNELSVNIRPTVETYNFTNTASIYFDGKLYVACSDGVSAFNNIVLVWDYQYQSWTKFVGWNVADWFIYQNVLYYGASNEIATYQALIHYDDNAGPYTTYWTSKWFDFGIPNEQKRLGLIYVEGYLTSNTTVGVSAYFDGNTASPTAKSIDGSNTNYVYTSDTLQVLGDRIWGQGIYGGGGAGGGTYTLRKFRWWGRYAGTSFNNFQIKIGTATDGYVYKITHIIPYLEKIPGKKIPISSLV